MVVWLLAVLIVACGGSADSEETTVDGANTTPATEETTNGEASTAPPGERDFVTLRFNTLIRVNPDDGTVTELGEIDGNVLDITYGGGSVWMAREDGSVVRMSPATGEVEAEIDSGVSDLGALIAFSDQGVWTVHGIIGSANTVDDRPCQQCCPPHRNGGRGGVHPRHRCGRGFRMGDRVQW